MKKVKVLMVLKSSIHNDSRVIKEATILTNSGYDVTVLYTVNKNESHEYKQYLFKTVRLNKPPGSRFFMTKVLFHSLKAYIKYLNWEVEEKKLLSLYSLINNKEDF